MCGIVGYVGPQDARDVVLDGLRRLEYRGYDSAGIAVVADGRLSAAKKAGKLANLEKVLADHPLPPRHDRHRAHPLGDPRRPDRPQRPPAPVRRRLGRGDPQRDHRELRRAAGRVRGAPASSSPPRPTPRSPRTCWPPPTPSAPRAGPAGRGDARRLPPAGGRLHPGRRSRAAEPDTLVAARRSSPLVVGVGDGRVLPRLRRRRLHRAHPRGARARPGPGRGDRPRPRPHASPTSTAPPVEPTAYTVDWDAAAAEKGGYDWFMLKEIAEQPQAVADTLLGRLGAAGRAGARRGAAVRPGAARHRQDLRRRLRHRLPRRPDRQVRHRALDPHPGRGGAGQRVPLPRPGARPLDAGRRHQPVRRDDGHADGAAARQGAEGPRAGHLQRQRLDHPARVRRRALHARRPRDRGRLDQGLPHPAGRLLPGRALPRPGARHEVRGRGRRDRRATCAGCPRRSPRCSRGMEPVRELARVAAPTRTRSSSSAGTSGSRWRSRAR